LTLTSPARIAHEVIATVGVLALMARLPWVACVAFAAASEVSARWRWPLRVIALAAAGWALWLVPFEQGQAALADAVLPFSLLAAAPLVTLRRARFLANALALSAAIFVVVAARTHDPLAEVAAALMLALAANFGRPQ
jgi:hypothetical protein